VLYLRLEMNKSNPRYIRPGLRHDVLVRDNFTCCDCGAKAPDVKLVIDHIIPVKHGGKSDFSNLRATCETCNQGKSDKMPGEIKILETKKKTIKTLQEEKLKIQKDLEKQEKKLKSKNFIPTKIKKFMEKLFSEYGLTAKINKIGLNNIKKLTEKHSIERIYESIDTSENILEQIVEKETLEEKKEVIERFINTVIYHTETTDYEKRKGYLRGVVRNRVSYFGDSELYALSSDLGCFMRQFDNKKDKMEAIECLIKLAKKHPKGCSYGSLAVKFYEFIETFSEACKNYNKK